MAVQILPRALPHFIHPFDLPGNAQTTGRSLPVHTWKHHTLLRCSCPHKLQLEHGSPRCVFADPHCAWQASVHEVGTDDGSKGLVGIADELMRSEVR